MQFEIVLYESKSTCSYSLQWSEKTAATAQECDNVRPYFLEANRLTITIDKAIEDGDIRIDEETGELIFDEDFLLEL